MKWIGCFLAVIVLLICTQMIYRYKKGQEDLARQLQSSIEQQQMNMNASVAQMNKKAKEISDLIAEQELVLAGYEKEFNEVRRKKEDATASVSAVQAEIATLEDAIQNSEISTQEAMSSIDDFSADMQQLEKDIRLLREAIKTVSPRPLP